MVTTGDNGPPTSHQLVSSTHRAFPRCSGVRARGCRAPENPCVPRASPRIHARERPMVGGRRPLPDLPALLRRCERRRHRGPRRHPRPPRPPARDRCLPGRGCDLAEPDLPEPARRLRLRHHRLHRRRSRVRDARRPRRADRRVPRPRPSPAHGPRPLPHLDRASVVRRVALIAGESEARLVSLGRPRPGRRAALELERDLRRLGLGVGPGDRAVLPPLVLPGTAGPELAQPGGGGGDRGGDALLARSWRRRLPRRRDPGRDQGRSAAGQSPVPTPGPDPRAHDRRRPGSAVEHEPARGP